MANHLKVNHINEPYNHMYARDVLWFHDNDFVTEYNHGGLQRLAKQEMAYYCLDIEDESL